MRGSCDGAEHAEAPRCGQHLCATTPTRARYTLLSIIVFAVRADCSWGGVPREAGEVSGVIGAGGGNCRNVCESGYAHFEDCLQRESCSPCDSSEDTGEYAATAQLAVRQPGRLLLAFHCLMENWARRVHVQHSLPGVLRRRVQRVWWMLSNQNGLRLGRSSTSICQGTGRVDGLWRRATGRPSCRCACGCHRPLSPLTAVMRATRNVLVPAATTARTERDGLFLPPKFKTRV